MCGFGAGLAALSGGAAASGAAAGTAAVASSGLSLGSILSTVGTIVGISGQMQQARAVEEAAERQSHALEVERQQTLALRSVEQWRARQKMKSQISHQRAQIAGRDLDLGSATAQFLGQTAAEELAFEGQAIQQGAQSRAQEITHQQQALDARGRDAMIRGRWGVAGTLLKRAPDLWPELLA